MSELDTIRRLIGAGRDEELAALAEELARLRRTLAELDRELPSLLRKVQTGPESRALSQALSPVVGEALQTAIQRDKRRIAEAIAPVIGPGIRKSISDAMRGLMDDINRIVEQSLTLRSLSWRWEAMRTGVPFAQVAMKNSFRYKVDHLLLIDSHSGNLLMAKSGPGVPNLDQDAVAGMLSAITDFVVDTMQADSKHDAGLASATIGEYLVQVYEGSEVRVALLLQGAPSRALTESVWACLEQIESRPPDPHQDDNPQWRLLAEAALDNIPLEGSGRTQTNHNKRSIPWVWIAVLLASLAGLAFLSNDLWQQRSERAAIRAAIAQQPGWVLLDLRRENGWEIRALRDPDAITAVDLASQLALANRRPARIREQSFLSNDPAIILIRAQRALQPPENVSIRLDEQTLIVSGRVEPDWLTLMRNHPPAIPGVSRLDTANLEALTDPRLDRLSELKILIDEIYMALSPGALPSSDELSPTVEKSFSLSMEAYRLGQALERDIRLRIIGWSDPTGAPALNQRLRLQRAGWFFEQLKQAGIPEGMMWIDPAGRQGETPGISIELEWGKTDEH